MYPFIALDIALPLEELMCYYLTYYHPPSVTNNLITFPIIALGIVLPRTNERIHILDLGYK